MPPEVASQLAQLKSRLALVQRLGGIGSWTAGLSFGEIHLEPLALAALGLEMSHSGRAEWGAESSEMASDMAGDMAADMAADMASDMASEADGESGGQRLGLSAWLALFAPEDRTALQAALKHAEADATPIDQTLLLASTSAAPRWVRVRGEAIGSGLTQRLEGTLQDVTAQVRAKLELTDATRTQQALRDSETRYDRALRGMSDGLWEWDVQGGAETLSPRCRELLGLAADASIDSGDGFFGRIHADDSGAARAAIQAHFQYGAPFDIELRLRL